MLEIANISEKIEDLRNRTKNALISLDMSVSQISTSRNHIRLVFVGQYSAGKSTILKMLTGRNDIGIGAGITTQESHTYMWNGIEVIDTPGIHTELRPDHDEISYEAIASADMLVFVVTNELFDSYIAGHFRKLAIDKDKAGEMILVVNKMERAADGNSESQQEIIKDDLKKVLAPYTPEQLNLSFLDAESYLDSIEERVSDPEVADELLERSGYNKFIDTLNHFVDEKSLTSKLTTELYVIDEQLEKAIKTLQPKSDDSDMDALEERYMQQRHQLLESRGRMQLEVKDIYTTAASKIRDLGNNAANLLVEGCKKAEVESQLTQYICQADDIIESSQHEAMEIIDSRLNEMGEQLEVIENSEFSRDLESRLSGKFEGLPEEVKKILTSTSPGFQRAGQAVLDKAYKAGAQGGLKLTNFSGSKIHDIVLRGGHAFGYKFKPWQAIKITKGVAIGSQVLSAVGVGFSIFMQIKSDQDEEKIRKDLKVNRQNIRSQFNTAANELENFARMYIKQNVNSPLENLISEIDGTIQKIRDTRLGRSNACKKLEDLKNECTLLIKDIHSRTDELKKNHI